MMLDLWRNRGRESREAYGPKDVDYDGVTEPSRGLRLMLRRDRDYAREVVCAVRFAADRLDELETKLERQRHEYESRIEALNVDCARLDALERAMGVSQP
jgi:hypothetical protein